MTSRLTIVKRADTTSAQLPPEHLTQTSRASIPILAAMGTRVLEAGHGRGVVELAAEPNVNHFGAVYAGSLFTVAEVLGGAISWSTFGLEGELSGFVPLVKSVEIDFLRPALGTVYARAQLSAADIERLPGEALAHDKASFVLQAERTDGDGTVLATTEGQYQLRRLG